jgi:hypothetical protein
MEALPRFEKISHTWSLILEFVGPNNSPYGRILSVDARLMLLGYSTEEVMHPNWEEELQECGSTQWRVFAGEEKQIVRKAERVGDFIALGDGTMMQTDVEGYLDGDYPVFIGRSKLVSREQFRVPGGRDSISSPELSSASSCADADACAAAAIQGNSGTIITSYQEAGLSEENNPQPTAIGSCGYAHFEGDIPPGTAEEASRRIEHAGSTPPHSDAGTGFRCHQR